LTVYAFAKVTTSHTDMHIYGCDVTGERCSIRGDSMVTLPLYSKCRSIFDNKGFITAIFDSKELS
jgi:hypothetical protein